MKKLTLLILSSFLFTACLAAGPDIPPPGEETEEIPEIMDADIATDIVEEEATEEEATEKETTEEETTEEEITEEETTEEESTEEEVVEEETTEAAEAEYITYTKETYDSLIGQSAVVLYFHANWCPLCVQLEQNITENLADFPKGSKILEVDFDEELGLRQEYGITVQATLLTLSADGEVIEKLSNPSNEDLIAAIEKTL